MFRAIHRWLRYGLLFAGGCVLLASASTGAQAGDPATETLLQRLDRLERQNEELKSKLDRMEGEVSAEGGAPADMDTKKVQKIVGDYLKTQEKEKKAKETEAKQKLEDEGYKVGTDLKINTR